MNTHDMRILQIVSPGRAQWRNAPIPRPQPQEVLIRVEGITTCPQWDLHIMDGEPMFPGFVMSYPYHLGQPGHEAAGEVVELGSEVKNLKVGARVAAWRDAGPARQGCYAQFAALPAENVMPIPEELQIAAIAPLELAMCVQVSFDQLAHLEGVAGKRVGIAGLGPGGLIAVQMARAYGAREVIGIDPLPERRALAERLGADLTFTPDDAALPADRKSPAALDTALDTTGLKVSIEALMARTQKTVAIFGVLREDVNFGASHWYGGFSLLGYGAHNRAAADRALQLVLQNKLRLAALLSRKMPLRSYAEGVARLRDKKAIKILFDPWTE
ncbi:MAG: zinc-dependent alcohol dehydrogenase [bacterium]